MSSHSLTSCNKTKYLPERLLNPICSSHGGLYFFSLYKTRTNFGNRNISCAVQKQQPQQKSLSQPTRGSVSEIQSTWYLQQADKALCRFEVSIGQKVCPRQVSSVLWRNPMVKNMIRATLEWRVTFTSFFCFKG